MDYYQCGDRRMPYDLIKAGDTEFIGETPLCKNPFYKAGDVWKSSEYLPPGEYGTRLDGLFKWAGPGVIGFFVLGFLINHLWHIRKVKFEVNLDETIDDNGENEEGE